MMTTTAATAPYDYPDEEQSLAYTMLLSLAYELHGVKGIGRMGLKEALLVYDQQQQVSVADHIDQIVETVCIDDPPEDEDPQVALEEAITSKDQKKLYAAAPYLAMLKRDQPLKFSLTMTDIKEAFGKLVNYSLLNGAIATANRAWQQVQNEEKPDVADIARAWAGEHRHDWAYDHQAESWRHWNGTYWELSREKSDILDQYVITALQEAEKNVDNVGVMNCFQRVAAAYCTRIFTPPAGKINFENGTLDLSSMQLCGHDRDDGFTYLLPYCYQANGKHPHISGFLEETIPDAHSRVVYMIHLGLALMGDTNFHKFVLLLGPTRCGKSTALALGNALTGSSPWDFAGPSLFARDLEGKRSRSRWSSGRMVCVDELPQEALMEEELLKAMTAHSGVEQRAIGKDEKTDNRWVAKLMMSTNDTPHYKDTSGAIKQRALIIECPNGPREEKDQDALLFQEKLLPELGAFASTCLQYAMLARQVGFYPKSAKMKEKLDRISSDGNPLRQFIEDECVRKPGERISIKAFHDAYKSYCLESNNKPMAKNKMSMAITDMHIGVIAKRMRLDDQKVTRALEGIRLRSVTEEPEETITDYEDDQLLTIVDDQLTVDLGIVHSTSEPVEPAKEGLLTLLTIDPKKFPIETPLPSTNGHKKDTYIPSIGSNGSILSSTTSTSCENEPVELVQGVDDTQKSAKTAVNSIVNSQHVNEGERAILTACVYCHTPFQVELNAQYLDYLDQGRMLVTGHLCPGCNKKNHVEHISVGGETFGEDHLKAQGLR